MAVEDGQPQEEEIVGDSAPAAVQVEVNDLNLDISEGLSALTRCHASYGVADAEEEEEDDDE